MGSWNGTCALSQLPIVEGDRVVLLFLKYNKYTDTSGGGFCYSSNKYKPMCPPICGEYDDYGAITKIDDNITVTLTMNYFLKNWHNYEFDNSEFERNKFPEVPTNIEELVNMVERGCIKDVGFMLIHEELYKQVVAEVGSRPEYDSNDDFRTKHVKLANECIEWQNNYNKDSGLDVKAHHEYFFNMELGNLEFSMIFEHFNMLDFVKALPSQKSDLLLNILVDFLIFTRAMEFSRKMYTPQCGAGSGAKEYYLPKLIGEFCIAKEQAIKAEWLEDNEIEDERDQKYYERCTREW